MLSKRKTSRTVALVQSILVAALLLPVGAVQALAAEDASPPAKCEHPHPCDYQWTGPAGPFEVRPMERVTVTSHDGVKLNGFLLRPEIPGDVPVPVIVKATPYVSAGAVPNDLDVGGLSGKEFAAAGYAVAQFSVRGTGDSDGCWGGKSVDEQRDMPVIIDWLASQPWSSGRVGMQGISYHGTTPVMAAMQNPPALKTIVIAGTILDEYQFFHSPQGAEFIVASVVGALCCAPLSFSLFPQLTPEGLRRETERVCSEMVNAAGGVLVQGELTPNRDPGQFWTKRRLIDRVPDITAATFVVHGFLDRYFSGHAFQDDWAWQTLQSAPKRMLVGHWGHEWPHQRFSGAGPERMAKDDWKQRLLAWFDYWLKGHGGSPPGIGEVDFQDNSGAWHRTDAWPPPLAKNSGRGHVDDHGPDAGLSRRSEEVVYLNNASSASEGKITPRADKEEASFLAVTPPWRGGGDPNPVTQRWSTPCPDPTRLVYTTDPLEEGAVLAGNPFAWLNIESSAPGGIFELQLFDVGPDFTCTDQPFNRDDLRPLTEGSIDLQFHQSEDYQARLFPVAQPTHVRVDLASVAEQLEPGHRLALVISRAVQRWGAARDFQPLITILGDGSPQSSHLVLPFVAGSFGGEAPTLDYPPTPFIPECCTETP